MLRRIKCGLMYSWYGMPVGGACLFALLELASRILTGHWMGAGRILTIYLWISAALTVFLTVSCMSLIRHEGKHIRNLTGVGLGLSWVLGNVICLALMGFGPCPAYLKTFAAVYGCHTDFFLSGLLLMAYAAAVHKPAYDKDFVIIPGCSISKKGGLLPLLKGRTNRAIRFAWDQERATGKPARYVPTGGQGPDEIMSEGSAMEMYLISHGAEQYEVFPEKASVNTYENLVFSKRIIDREMKHAKTCYVTTNYHVLRSGLLARIAGLDAEGLASGTKWYFWPNGLAREIIAILAMYPVRQALAALACAALAAVL